MMLGMGNIIQPKILKGFRDFLPEVEIPRRHLIRSLEDHFHSYGYVPIDTPILEYAQILLSKGGGETDKQTYRFTDKGGRDVALRFDLTVPFARYVAAHKNELPMPFKRYHIAKAWRGENTQRGRYREFIQCDFDIVGTDSLAADLEIMIMMHRGLSTLGAGKSKIRFSHRGLLNSFLINLGLEKKLTDILRIIDKLGKVGVEQVQALLAEHVQSPDTLLDFITAEKDNRTTLAKMKELAGETSEEDHTRILKILDITESLSMEHDIILDPSITRGLDYYTGIVFETFLDELPSLGSVCSGGRYANLTGLFMKDYLSGVGASIGLDRLMAGLNELKRIESRASCTDVLVLMLDETLLLEYQKMAQELRDSGLFVELYPEEKKIATQFKYAEAKGIPLALIVGSDEMSKNTVNLKDLRNRENFNDISFSRAKKMAQDILHK